MVRDLLQNHDETLHQVFVFCWLSFARIYKVVERGGHHAWVFVAKSSLHFHVKLVDWNDLVELHHYNDCFFPNHLILMGEQLVHGVSQSHHNLLVYELGQHGESSQHL